jgi:hypothetical protein
VFASLEYIKSSKLISINSSSSRGDGPPLHVAVVLSFVFIRLFEILISFIASHDSCIADLVSGPMVVSWRGVYCSSG